MTRTRSPHRVALLATAAASAVLGGLALAAPAAAQGVIGTGSGRTGASVAALVALVGVITGWRALARCAGRGGNGNGRDGAIVALVLGVLGMVLAALHLATSSGGIGTGNGRAGALVALALGLIASVLGRLGLARSIGKVGVRYMIDDVPAAVEFYTTCLGFRVEQDASPAFAAVSRDGVRLLLSGEGSSGKRPLADGRSQLPGGWNRIHLQVGDLASEVERLQGSGVPFRTKEVVDGPAGAQVIIDDPSGNPIELFQARRAGARRGTR